jgi:4,4'-diaponeurosporenoate glycosyltransferase
MLILTLLSIGGLFAGLLLLRTVPVVTTRPETDRKRPRVSVIIPARNEAANLPLLLDSLHNSASGPSQILVIDDASTDDTAAVAVRHGAGVIASLPLPQGWTGKTWACHQGARAAAGEILFFLDADTRFVQDGYQRIVESFATMPQNAALSLLPFHQTQRRYEELSLFFNILVAMGAGGFGRLDAPHLFGQSLLVRKEMYARAGGHAAVKREILENLHFAAHLLAANCVLYALGGRGTLEMRMFPHGLQQLRESWQKAFAAGAGITTPLVLGLSIYWLAGAMLTALMLIAVRSPLYPAIVALYLLNVAQIAWYGRQLGTFRRTTALFYPAALAYYLAIFAQSMWRQKRGSTVTWRGREL